MPRKAGELYVETQEKITFEISGADLEKVRRFRELHKTCFRGEVLEQFTYSFSPSGMGVAMEVRCSCGKILELGDFAGAGR